MELFGHLDDSLRFEGFWLGLAPDGFSGLRALVPDSLIAGLVKTARCGKLPWMRSFQHYLIKVHRDRW